MFLRLTFLLTSTCLLIFFVSPAMAIDWDKIKPKEVYLFYTGQASWEWALSQNEHSGANMIKEGRKCRACHIEQEEMIGDKILSGHPLETNPIAGMPGFIIANVKTAHDDQRLYIRLHWQPSGIDLKPVMDPDYESRVSIMLDDGSVTEASRAGCWASCHSDNTGMPHASSESPLTKYLPRSRKILTREGGGGNFKSETELDQMLQEGKFMEYWLAKLNRDAAPTVHDGHVLEKRNVNTSPEIDTEAVFKDNMWIVTFSRALNISKPGYKSIEPGKTYHLGFAIHDTYTTARYHYVSFEHTLMLDKGRADFITK